MEYLEMLSNLNWQTIIAMFVTGWYFSRDLKPTLQKINDTIADQSKRSDKLYEIWVQTQKDMSDLRMENNQKWVETQKEMMAFKADSNRKFYDLLERGRK